MMHKGLNQLLCAATVNRRFREALLRNPSQAIATGYFNHCFLLTPDEQRLVASIQASQLEEFAAQVYCWLSSSSDGHGVYALDVLSPARESAQGLPC